MKRLVLFISITFFLGSFIPKREPSEKDVLLFVDDYIQTFHKHAGIHELVFVSIKQQRLYLIRYGHMVTSYPISTSRYGVGNRINSQKTPTGVHWIKKKMGNHTPINGILKGGVYTGAQAQLEYQPSRTDSDHVTTRALWLEGMEYLKNKGGKVDSYQRHIYIHGTHEEGLIGKPASHGCIRMKNYDVKELFDLVETGLYVLILNV